MKRFAFLSFSLLLVILSLVSCNRYSSHYYTIAHGTSFDSDSASVFFGEFEGTEVFKMKIESGKTARIQYSGKLETGNLTVYYDCNGEKTVMFSICSGDEVNACTEELPVGKVYVIIETSEKCVNGSFDFKINYD